MFSVRLTYRNRSDWRGELSENAGVQVFLPFVGQLLTTSWDFYFILFGNVG